MYTHKTTCSSLKLDTDQVLSCGESDQAKAFPKALTKVQKELEFCALFKNVLAKSSKAGVMHQRSKAVVSGDPPPPGMWLSALKQLDLRYLRSFFPTLSDSALC